jgi:hypothetical protein
MNLVVALPWTAKPFVAGRHSRYHHDRRSYFSDKGVGAGGAVEPCWGRSPPVRGPAVLISRMRSSYDTTLLNLLRLHQTLD